MKKRFRITAICVLLLGMTVRPTPAAATSPDPVQQWIAIMNDTVLSAGTSPFFTSRIAAMVSASVFDAVNGIDPRFRPLHVPPNAPHNASQRAAAVQAAYVILADAYPYPAQSAALTAQRNASLAALALTENAKSIAAGVAWGQTVADAIWAWRQADGFAPPPRISAATQIASMISCAVAP